MDGLVIRHSNLAINQFFRKQNGPMTSQSQTRAAPK